MKFNCQASLLSLIAVIVIGCQQSPAPTNEKQVDKKKAEIQASLAKLSPENRKLAEAQKMCPIGDAPLGSMGEPVSVTLNDEVVFLCCKGCKDQALAHPEKTLARVKALKGTP